MAGGRPAHTGGAGEAAALSAFLDTNVLIRHLTGDPPAQARRASAFLAAAEELLVPDLIIAEVVFVLDSRSEARRWLGMRRVVRAANLWRDPRDETWSPRRMRC
jgi:predicted nucleic acid-binding protein